MGHGIDLTGGWTWAFNISYESLIKHRLTGFLNCENKSVHTSEFLPPMTIGSGAAPLSEDIRHHDLSDDEIRLVQAWMDTNSNYYGTWDYTEHATCQSIVDTVKPLTELMKEAGCVTCHKAGHIGNDWVNLQTPNRSRILRAPMRKKEGTLGLGFCRDRKARAGYPLVVNRTQPHDIVFPTLQPEWDPSGAVHVSFESNKDSVYQRMLATIQAARRESLKTPRVDMPGAEASIIPGECRMRNRPGVPMSAPEITAVTHQGTSVLISWQRTAETIGLDYEVHRASTPDFRPSELTRLARTTGRLYVDQQPPEGRRYYALVVTDEQTTSAPSYAEIDMSP